MRQFLLLEKQDCKIRETSLMLSWVLPDSKIHSNRECLNIGQFYALTEEKALKTGAFGEERNIGVRCGRAEKPETEDYLLSSSRYVP